MSYVEFFGM